jgi:hypothetical protein
MLNKSRRNWLRLGVISALGLATAGHLVWQRHRIGHRNVNVLPGEKIVSPTPPDHQCFIRDVVFSADSSKILVVCGNITEQFLFIADFPVNKSTNYKLVKRFSNCLKIDGVSISSGVPTRITCRMTGFRSEYIAPSISTEQEWRNYGKTCNIKDVDFFSRMLVLSAEGNEEKSFSLPISHRDRWSLSSTWYQNETFLGADVEHKTIVRCNIQDSKVSVLFNNNSAKDMFDRSYIKDIAWNDDLKKFVILGSRGNVFFMDESEHYQEAKELTTRIAEGKSEFPPSLDSAGNSIAFRTGNKLLRLFVGNSKIEEIVLPSNVFPTEIYTINSKGTFVLQSITDDKVEPFAGITFQVM